MQKDGGTLREHLNMAYQASGILPEQLADHPPLPELAAYLWDWFIELSACRGNNGMGLSPISWADYANWQAVTRTTLQPWELRTLRTIDHQYLIQASKRND